MAEFDIAISFAGEDRSIAQELARRLTQMGARVFYDDYEQANLLGETLTEYLIDIYKNKASYCVVLVSEYYVKKRWTRHEWKAAQARAFNEYDKAYILPIRIDSSELPGLLETIGYLSVKNHSIEKISELIIEKTKRNNELNYAIRLAYNALKNSDFEIGIKEITKPELKEQLDKSDEALGLLGSLYVANGDSESALKIYRSLIANNPSVADYHFLAGTCLFRTGKLNEAKPFYRTALTLNPKHFTARLDYNVLKRLSWLAYLPFFRYLFFRFNPVNELADSKKTPNAMTEIK